MARKNLTDKTIRALKPGVYEIMDTVVPGMAVRVSGTGRRSFILIARYPGSKNPTRRVLGVYGAMTLVEARDKAREWLADIGKGVDPALKAERQRAATLQRQGTTFAAVLEDFLRLKVAGERKGHEVATDMRRVFLPLWGNRPISDITALEVRDVIVGYRNKPYQGHNLIGYLRRFYTWAIDQQIYNLESSPCDRLKATALLGEKQPRSRTLSDIELRALWNAAEQIEYPYGPFVKMLLLTGQRRSEVAECRWSEIDMNAKSWVVPAQRMKMGAAHMVPLSDDAMAVLDGLPRFEGGDCVFSTAFGKNPVGGFTWAKTILDKAMVDQLGSTPPAWVFHDIRRTVRTHLSALPISSTVAELVIGHTQRGLHKIYDLHSYETEKRNALQLWAERLNNIIHPKSGNVVSLRA